MNTVVRKIGNSRGIIIPHAFLEACEIRDRVEMEVQDKRIMLKSADRPRERWFEGYHAEKDENPGGEEWRISGIDLRSDEWEW